MKQIDDNVLEAVAELICATDPSETPGPYRSMWEIQNFFNRAGITPRSQHQTRKWFALESLQAINGTSALESVLIRLASPREYPGDVDMLREVISGLNNVLAVEGIEIVLDGVEPRLQEREASIFASQTDHAQPTASAGNRVFIGHGHSQTWRELKDFVEGRLGLAVDEFDRIPTQGLSVKERLTEMLDSAGIAFLVMTGEDEQPDGRLRARENVIHEVGLFQGRLGFERAIVLLEDGCEGFSNIAGLVHIPFPKGRIRGAFEDIREVLERERMISG